MSVSYNQRKRPTIMINLEPAIAEIAQDVIAREGVSASSYARRLILQDLRDRGLLPDSFLAEMTVNR